MISADGWKFLIFCFLSIGFIDALSAIDKRFEFLESHDTDECECAVEALGQIGSCKLSSK